MSARSGLVPSVIVAVLVATLVASASATEGLAPFRIPRYALPRETDVGERSLNAIQAAAKSEGLLDKMWGRNCFSQALRQFDSQCQDLGPAQKARLAFSLTRCQLLIQGEQDEPRLHCKPSIILKTCLNGLSSREHSIYVELLSSIDVACLFIQNVEFERHAEQVLNDLVRYGVDNSKLVSKLSQELHILLGVVGKQNNNASTAAAAFKGQLHDLHEQVTQTAVDIRQLFETIKSDAAVVERFQQSLKTDINALIDLQSTTARSLQSVVAADVTLQDTAFFAAAILFLVLSNSVGVPAKLRAIYFSWIVSVLAIERTFRMTSQSKVLLRKGLGFIVVTGWICIEWIQRRRDDQPVAPSTPKSEKTLRRSPRRKEGRHCEK